MPNQKTNRRSLIKNLAMAGAAVGAASTIGVTTASAASAPTATNAIDVVQFALQLEYLEAEFYTIATTGKTLTQTGIDVSGSGRSGPTYTKYGKVDFSNNEILSYAVAMDIAADERAHVKLLRSALMSYGVTPVAKPQMMLDALDAKGASLKNMTTFLVLARIFEDIGVSAYSGGATSLTAVPPVLMTAARILAVEGEHVANVRLQIARLGIATFPWTVRISSPADRIQLFLDQHRKWPGRVPHPGRGSLPRIRRRQHRFRWILPDGRQWIPPSLLRRSCRRSQPRVVAPQLRYTGVRGTSCSPPFCFERA